MDLQLDGKIILITGGAKGIGAAIVRTCAQEGAVPIICDKDREAGEKLNAELLAAGYKSAFFHAELTLAEACKAAVDSTLEKFGRLDALVNNAGVNDNIGLASGSPEKFSQSLQRNLYHCYYMAHYALPALKRARGAIVNISSKTAITGQGNTSGYVAAKAAILGLTREWAAELLPDGIRVNAVLPAEVMTPLYRRWLDSLGDPEVELRRITEKIPLGRRMTLASEIAAATVFLLSPTQSGHTTGQHVIAD